MGLGKLKRALSKVHKQHKSLTKAALKGADDLRRGDVKGATQQAIKGATVAAEVGKSVFDQGRRDLRNLNKTQPPFERAVLNKAIELARQRVQEQVQGGGQKQLPEKPFFDQFLEGVKKQPLPNFTTLKYPSDNEDSGPVQVSMKYPSDQEDNGGGNFSV